MTTPMDAGRHAGTERRRARVQDAITTAIRDGTPLTTSAIARAAGVDRTFLYRHRDLLDHLHTTSRSAAPPGGADVTTASLRADLANANARAARLAARVTQLEEALSRRLGEKAWAESGLGDSAGVAELKTTITHLEQHNAELARQIEEREAELEAARAANRQLTRALNHQG
ncbi:hypothetical protein [Streptomyces sp. NRRL F-5527]|uniref:hypothetical protein n=1 Tax=Streptomyces TaxID=1883 RepID=UPI0004CC7889|nr:hypothetical protein [Streptomyces sp. NRRL F-5527]